MDSVSAAGGSYGRFEGSPSLADLNRFFFLDETDVALVHTKRGAHNRLGFALQLTTLRYLGVFLGNPADVPAEVVTFLGDQLGMVTVTDLDRYASRPKTAYEHAWEIRQVYGFRAFENPAVSDEFGRYLAGRAWTHAEGPAALLGCW